MRDCCEMMSFSGGKVKRRYRLREKLIFMVNRFQFTLG